MLRKCPFSIRVLSVVYDTPEIVDHFIAHYLSLGADEVHLAVVGGLGIQWWQGHRVLVHAVPKAAFSLEHKSWCETLLANDVSPDMRDYFVRADIDEFHEFPCDLPTLAMAAAGTGVSVVNGTMVDHVARIGMPAIKAGVPIWLQYPVEADITGRVLHSDRRKVMLSRADVSLRSASHHEADGGVPGTPVGDPSNYRVHHFKWNAGTLARMSSRIGEGAYGDQCSKAVDYLSKRSYS